MRIAFYNIDPRPILLFFSINIWISKYINTLGFLRISFGLTHIVYRRDMSIFSFLFFFSFFFISSAQVSAEINYFLIIRCGHIIECILSPNALTAINLKNITKCLLILYCVNISLISYTIFTTKLTTSSVTYRAVVNSILRQNGTSYRIFVLLSMVAQYIHVLPAKRIDNKMKGWTDRTKRRTHRQSDKQTDILYDHRTIWNNFVEFGRDWAQ